MFVVALLLAVLTPIAPAAAAPSSPPDDVDPDSLLVRLAQPTATVLDERGLHARRPVGRTGYLEVSVPPARLEATRRVLAADRRVAAVQYNHVYRALSTPNDPRFPEQIGLQRVRAPAAWDEQTAAGPGAGQVIAVVDTGVDLDHPDLLGQLLLTGRDFVDDSDGDGVDDSPANGDPIADDEHGHGTLVAGIAAAKANNLEGIAGVADAAKVLPVRVLNKYAFGTEADIVEGIEFATDEGADVINLSLGSFSDSLLMRTAVQDAIDAGAVVVAATGNSGAPIPTYPAAYPDVLAVGAIDDADGVTWFSEFGDWVDLVAPGVNVLSTKMGGGYLALSGTSFSAPFAAGAAAMVKAQDTSMSAADVVARLRSSAQDVSHPGPDPYYGAGILDVLAAVTDADDTRAPVPIAAGDAHEASEPTLLTLSSQGTVSLNTATISPEGDVDTFAFDVPAAGAVLVTVTPGDSPSSSRLLDPVLTAGRAGGPMTELDQSGPLRPEYLPLQQVTAGRYVATVRNYNASRTAAYTLTVYFYAEPPPSTTAAAPPPPTPPPPPPPPTPRSGYWMLDQSGRVYPFGDAGWFGDGGLRAVDIEPTPSGEGYWIVDQHTSIYARGDAPYLGGTRQLESGELVTSISRTRTGQGVWLFTNRGRVITYGDARHFGDMSGTALNGPVLDSIPTPTGNGYYMVASDGGVFAFGDAVFAGSMGDTRLNQPVQSLVPDVDNRGYWLVASDGGIFAFDAGFFGSMGDTRLNRPITGMVRSGTGNGYLMVAEDGGIFAFGDAQFHGSLGDNPPAAPITSVAYLGT